MEGVSGGRRKRSELMDYYRTPGNLGQKNQPKFDLQSAEFDSKLYAQKLIKECSLKQLLEEEAQLSTAAQKLDSDCQTLVYDHYDKFLHATDLVHKLKEGSSEMEQQLQQLQANMALITQSSSVITAGLKERRSELCRLLGVHNTLQKLEFLFHLPNKIDECIAQDNMQEAVSCYLSTSEVLVQHYHHNQKGDAVNPEKKNLGSLAAVHKDCEQALCRLTEALHRKLTQGSSKDLATCIDLLLQLGEPRHTLQDSFLQQAQHKLGADMQELQALVVDTDGASACSEETKLPLDTATKNQEEKENIKDKDLSDNIVKENVESGRFSSEDLQQQNNGQQQDYDTDIKQQQQHKEGATDLLMFVEQCHDTFVAKLWLFISSYQEMFLTEHDNSSANKAASAKLYKLVDSSIASLVSVVRQRVRAEVRRRPLHCAVMAAALDKLHRRLMALQTLVPHHEYTYISLQVVLEATQLQCAQTLLALQAGLENTLADVRQGIASNNALTDVRQVATLGTSNTIADMRQVSERGVDDVGGVRQSFADSRRGVADVRRGSVGSSNPFTDVRGDLASLLSHLVASTAADIKQKVSILLVFLDGQNTFSSELSFRKVFIIQQVRESTVVAFLRHLTQCLKNFAKPGVTNSSSSVATSANVHSNTGINVGISSGGGGTNVEDSEVNVGTANMNIGTNTGTTSASLLLVLARAAWDLHTSIAHYMLRECDEALGMERLLRSLADGGDGATPSSTDVTMTSVESVTAPLKEAAQELLDAYVARQGAALVQLLVRSVEVKDWLGCGEPRDVRRVIRTVKQDLDACEIQVSSLYKEGTRKDRSSDSSRRTYHSSSMAGGGGRSRVGGVLNHPHHSHHNTSLNLSKLWCDRMEVYATVQPDKLSIMTGLVKIALKAVEEALRVRTLSVYGVQQVQVDTHYLRTHLWRHVGDEQLLDSLLDAVLDAALLRCVQQPPTLMEEGVVQFICGG